MPIARLARVLALPILLVPAAAHAVAPPIPGVTATVTHVEGAIPLPDGDPSGRVSLLDFDGEGVVVDVDVSVNLPHEMANNVELWLVSPSGTTITLTTDNGGANVDVFAGVTFDDQAPGAPLSAANVRNVEYTDGVPIGVVQPEEALGALVGERANGSWALVMVDDAQDGNIGTLEGWSLTLLVSGGLQPSAPVTVQGEGDRDLTREAGLSLGAVVAGMGNRLFDLNVQVNLTHDNAGELDVFLTSPSGRTIDLVTDVGGGLDGLFEGTLFDDHAGTPIGDVELPEEDGVALTAVVGEGALAAFLGENPNGEWTLTVVDDGEPYDGTVNAWSLTLVTATVCGDGTVDTGEQCDDGNIASGDGCDSNCTPTACGNGVVSPDEDCDDGNTTGGDGCPSTCHDGETSCDDCADNDGNGLVDAADPACEPGPLTLRTASIRGSRGKLKLTGKVDVPAEAAGPVRLTIADANGQPVCVDLGELPAGKRRGALKAGVGEGYVSVKLARGAMTVRGKGLDLSSFDDPTVGVGLSVGDLRFGTSGLFRPKRGDAWVYP